MGQVEILSTMYLYELKLAFYGYEINVSIVRGTLWKLFSMKGQNTTPDTDKDPKYKRKDVKCSIHGTGLRTPT